MKYLVPPIVIPVVLPIVIPVVVMIGIIAYALPRPPIAAANLPAPAATAQPR
jgi:hypothetical protein